MEFNGTQRIQASQERVFHALLNPEVLKNSVPGCKAAEYAELSWLPGRHIKLTISPNLPGLSGTYDIYITPQDLVEPSHLVLVSTPSSSLGSINARCVVDLATEGEHTVVNYATSAVLEGKIAATPEFVIKTAAKGAVDHFFKNLEKHIK